MLRLSLEAKSDKIKIIKCNVLWCVLRILDQTHEYNCYSGYLSKLGASLGC